ncbi:MAG TPA: alpha/beta hydrolase [Burkholderiaceae bacterium]|nr:alpha/beta hydrolase [Burkholderiaceae bacterium]HQR70793.1 alpha/beta hydrolase [Burkholderiaceae bacterium]
MVMQATLTAGSEPPYLQYRTVPGGALRRWLLHRLLKVTVKRWKFGPGEIDRLRREQAQVDRRFGKVDPQLTRRPVDAGGVAAEWIDAPETQPQRTLLYIHGGAFVLRFPNMHAALAGRWCRGLGARALMVDYRLAPEHPYPAALDDCVAAYLWLLRQGTRPEEIVVAGDSAGGNLTLALLLRLKASHEPLPRCAVLLSPAVDFTLSSPSLFSNGGSDPMFTLDGLAALRLMYARPEQFLDPTVSPLYGDFAGLPPLLFHAGDVEMLRDESTRAAARAHAAGVPVEVEIWRDMAHVFHALPLPQAAAAEGRLLNFIARHTGWTVSAG